MVSVPLRGKGRDQLLILIGTTGKIIVSVPLRGKGRDQHSWVCKVMLLSDYLRFPSPCGEKVGINITRTGYWHSSVCAVSVPLRGKGRDQLGQDQALANPGMRVSVPLRGKGRDQQPRRKTLHRVK